MVEETSDLTGSSWSTSGQYLRAGGGCNSLLIRRKSSTDDEYNYSRLPEINSIASMSYHITREMVSMKGISKQIQIDFGNQKDPHHHSFILQPNRDVRLLELSNIIPFTGCSGPCCCSGTTKGCSGTFGYNSSGICVCYAY